MNMKGIVACLFFCFLLGSQIPLSGMSTDSSILEFKEVLHITMYDYDNSDNHGISLPSLTLNNPPYTPDRPSGPTSGEEGVWYTFCSSTIDPDGDMVRYYWTDGESGYWTSFHESGETCCVSMVFTVGTHAIRVMAQDEQGLSSEYSPSLIIDIIPMNNEPWAPLQPDGVTSGYVNASYQFSAVTTDPNEDDIRYAWDWDGDFEIDVWSGYRTSGSTDFRSHRWENPGLYEVRVKAEDRHGKSSNWSPPLEVIINESEADLDCEYSLGWSSVKPGTTVTDNFTVKNAGTPGSILNWKIESYPSWGEWTFHPSQGTNVTPEDGVITVEVTLVVPAEEDDRFIDEVKVVNTDDKDDYEIIPVSLTTEKNKETWMEFFWWMLPPGLSDTILSLIIGFQEILR